MKKQRETRSSARKYAAWLLFCLLLMPLQAIAEKRAKQANALDCLMREASKAVSVDWEITLGDRVSIRIDGYEIGDAFEYSPTGGFSSVVLSAREGYCLLCLYISADNETDEAFNTMIFQGMELLVDDDAVTARGSFFQAVKKGTAQNPFENGSSAAITGYLLFALPEDSVASDKRLTVTLYYEEREYSCFLNPEAAEAEKP